MMRVTSDGSSILYLLVSASAVLGAATPELAVMLVLVAPGKTTLTWTLLLSVSAYRPSVNNLTAALEAP